MTETTWKGRKAHILDSGKMRLVFLPGGGHIGALELKDGPAAGLNPLWEPPWPSLEPEDYDPPQDDPAYGGPPEGRLLASIRGHNMCFPWFGPPLPDEVARGLGVHGEAPLARWSVKESPEEIDAAVELPKTGFTMQRRLVVRTGSAVVRFETEVFNRMALPQEFGWQEHVTIGPPFLEGGVTIRDHSGRRSLVMPAHNPHHGLKPDTEFSWPDGPGVNGKPVNLRIFTADAPREDFTSHLMEGDPAWFTAVNPRLRILIGYCWKSADFPWLGMWNESRSMHTPPWNGKAVSCGLEFGLSPHTKRPMPERVFGIPTLAHLPGDGTKNAVFHAFITEVPPNCTGVREVHMEEGVAVVSLLSPDTTIRIS